jgi:hypothetical protein
MDCEKTDVGFGLGNLDCETTHKRDGRRKGVNGSQGYFRPRKKILRRELTTPNLGLLSIVGIPTTHGAHIRQAAEGPEDYLSRSSWTGPMPQRTQRMTTLGFRYPQRPVRNDRAFFLART